jgi:hypothetical protein
MYPRQIEQMATLETDLRTKTPRRTDARLDRMAALASRARAQQTHRHPVRRRAGYALISLGLRLAYAAGEE